jgi:YidC/Oxa1 family membrane protein insertase
MSATTFTTQRQLMVKGMPKMDSKNNMMLQQQKIMLYLFPVIFAVSGVNFPVGVLIYWSTTNLWTWGQQYYVIKRNPTPGSPAFEELQKKKAEKLGMTVAEMEAMNDPKKAKSVNGQGSGSEGEAPKQEGQRTQPTKNKKKKKKK